MTLPRGFRRSSRAPPAIPSDPPAQRDVHTDDDHQDSHSDNITAPNGPDEILSAYFSSPLFFGNALAH
jgi:hypothetical protein